MAIMEFVMKELLGIVWFTNCNGNNSHLNDNGNKCEYAGISL
jgi:hypothetical protein